MSSRPSRGAARLAAILDALPDALLLVNANGTVVNANTIALEAFETPGTALVGRGLLDLLPQFDSRLIPGSMRRPDHIDPRARTKPTRMTARRTDGTEFPVEVTSANLQNGQQAYDGSGYTADELLMLVVRDLAGTVDTEAELARSQRQTEMILRAASEGVVGTDTDGRIVLVNPAAAQILGYRAGELGGRELHTLVLHSRADGSPFPYEESPLADTLRSGRKHRVRGQVVWSKAGDKLPVDLTTAPVRDGDQLVGAVMTFTDRRPYDALAEEMDAAAQRHAEERERLAEEHAAALEALRRQHAAEIDELTERHAEELAAGEDRYAALGEREKDRYEALAARHEQLLTLLGGSLRGPLDELRRELAALAADDAGQLWPEANQVLHHLSAGYSRITTLIDNVLGYQRLDIGSEQITRTKVMLDAVVAAGVDGAVDLVGPGRVQFAVHAPPIEAEVDPQRLATALAHLVADVAGVDATGNAPVSTTGYMDNTVVVAAAQRGAVVRIEVRGPYAGGDPVHEPIVRGIVRAHGGVLQTHQVPGMSGSAYVLEVPIGGGAGAMAMGLPGTLEPAAPHTAALGPAGPAAATGAPGTADAPGAPGAHGTGAGTAQTDPAADPEAGAGPRGGDGTAVEVTLPAQATGGGGRRRARRASTDAFLDGDGEGEPSAEPGTGSTPTGRRRRRAVEEPAPEAVRTSQGPDGSGGTGRRRGRPADPDVAEGAVVTAAEHAAGTAASGSGLGGTVPPQGVPVPLPGGPRDRYETGEPHALPAAPGAPGAAPDRPAGAGTDAESPAGPGAPAAPASAVPVPAGLAPGESGGAAAQPTGRRRRALAAATERAAAQEAAPRTVFALPPADADRPAAGAEGPQMPQTPHVPHVPQTTQQAQEPKQAPRQAQVQAQLPHQGPAVPVQDPAAAPGAVPGAGPGAVPGVGPGAAPGVGPDEGRHDAVGHDQADDHTPPQPHPASVPTGRRRRAVAEPAGAAPAPSAPPAPPAPAVDGSGTAPVAPPQPWPGGGTDDTSGAGVPLPPAGATGPVPSVHPGAPLAVPGTPLAPGAPAAAPGVPHPAPRPGAGTPPHGTPSAPGTPVTATPATGTPLPPEQPVGRPAMPGTGPAAGAAPRAAQPLPAESAVPVDPNSTQGRSISVRTLGQGVPFSRQAAQVQQPTATPPPHAAGGSGRRRKLGTPPDPAAARPEQQPRQQRPDQAAARPHPPAPERPAPQPSPNGSPVAPAVPAAPAAPAAPAPTAQQSQQPQAPLTGQPRLAQASEGAGRSYAIGAPDENAAEGPEPLDGPGGAVEVADPPRPQPMDDELPPEPLDNPRRLLVWPAPDVTTQQALSDRGYRPVIVHSREEVDAQIAAFPAALFVDPLTGPITRTALQSLRQAAVAAEVPVLVTAGLGQATREAAYGADPAVLLKALAPRDSEQHPPRVLLIEEHAEIALALTATLERRGMQVARAASDADAVALAGRFRPNLVVMDLMQVHRRRAGILDWLRANGQLNRTPLVVYTAAVDQADLPRLASGETVLFLAERSTSTEVQTRIVDLLARIGTN
ncbi:hybrid sensor histidine kinase/response regulator [Streptomyces sp. NRRL S-340]|uniref:response regulator n=1 Tax=Streptomyces sp. NRRL S-340 TaxID=1463901 RepID=UPI000AC38C08|nr:hybrid sensor histidine kinase/response regulator [Streptomyces sp. NRRL S-340]